MFSDPLVIDFDDPAYTFRTVDVAPLKTVRRTSDGKILTISHQDGNIQRSVIRLDGKVALPDSETPGDAAAYIVFVRPRSVTNTNQTYFLESFITGISAALNVATGNVPADRFAAMEP